jgi:hypothetical protein
MPHVPDGFLARPPRTIPPLPAPRLLGGGLPASASPFLYVKNRYSITCDAEIALHLPSEAWAPNQLTQ